MAATLAEVESCVASLRTCFRAGRTLGIDFRIAQLSALLRLLTENEAALTAALSADLGKPAFEANIFEVSVCQAECRRFIKHLPAWSKPKPVASPVAILPASSRIERQPFGVALVISAFNYPLQLSILPLIAALGAGNTVLLKPSEMAPKTAALIAQLLPRYLYRAAYQVVEGGVATTTALLRQKFDYIFFTGSETVGKIVLRAAAEHCTPVTLELGGKSPTYIDQTADLQLAARRVVWGKLVNAGQTCIAPDYVLVHHTVEAEFTRLAARCITEMLGPDPRTSASFARIVNERHAARLAGYLADGKVAHGGSVDVAQRYVGPTLLTNVRLDAPVMRDEIFGSILPIVPVADADAAVAFINARPKPLALYVFAADAVAESVVARTSSGGVAINDTLMHFTNFELPFGGVGASGMGGAYHGRFGFETFSHARAVVRKAPYLDAPQRYAPYTPGKERVLRFAAETQAVDSGVLGRVAAAAAAVPAGALGWRLLTACL